MKATGIVRRIDDLGRVVIPKEIRRTMRIREGDPLEIFTNVDGQVVFKKYSPVGELGGYVGEYAEVLFRAIGMSVIMCDRDHVVASAGPAKRELNERRISKELETLMEERRQYVAGESEPIKLLEGLELTAAAVSPILAAGDIIGAVCLLNGEGKTADVTDIKLVQVAASFLGRQVEE